jgi:hypothetical protein
MNLNISPCTGDDTTWGIIQGWLAACLQTHGDRCNERPSATFVPPRLLQLEPAAETFRVVHATEVEPGTRYVTLSHCCCDDDDGLPGLDKSTLQQLSMSTPQPLSILPLTLREACTVVVARLGLRHLWVDRLCIPRDDLGPSGFARVARRDVFRNAFLNIAASGTSGLFVKRDPALVAPTVFDFPVSAGATVPHRSSLEMFRGWTRAFRDDPLSRSATALQERLLAPRVVHFGGKMVFWECHGATCAEIHPHGVLNQTLTPSGPEARPWKTLLNSPSARRARGDDPVEQAFADWFAILETHSACGGRNAGGEASCDVGPGSRYEDVAAGQRVQRDGVCGRDVEGHAPGWAGVESAWAWRPARQVQGPLVELGCCGRDRELSRQDARAGCWWDPALRACGRYYNLHRGG